MGFTSGFKGLTDFLYRGADKSVARPGRIEATATKLLTFASHLKKNSEVCPSNQVSAAAMTSASDEKCRAFNCFFQSRQQVVVRRGQIQRIGWVIKTLEPQVSQFLLGCKCLVSWGIVMQEQDPLVTFPQRFFFKMSLNCTSRDE